MEKFVPIEGLEEQQIKLRGQTDGEQQGRYSERAAI
jgi:hypothetical protein